MLIYRKEPGFMEDNRQNNTLLLEYAGKWAADRLKNNKIPLSAGFITGLLCYLYALTNKLINHDEAYSLFSKGATVTSGRWGLGLLDSIFPNYSMPWINGILALVFMVIAAALFVRLLSIRSGVMQGLLAGAIVAFPSLICTFSYMFTVHAFALSFLLAVCAVWLLQKKSWLMHIFALGCMIASLSIYQSYISVAAGLLVLILIRQLLEGETLSDVIRRGFGFVFFLALSLGLYYAATQLVLKITGVSMNSYAGGNVQFSLTNILGSLGLAYRDFARFFLDGYWGLMHSGFSRAAHLLCIGCALVLMAAFAVSRFRREFGRLALLAALVGILPLAVNCMYLFTGAAAVHTLVLYGFVSLYGLCAVAADVVLSGTDGCRFRIVARRIGLELLSLAMAAVIFCNVFLANQVWLNLQLRYENAYAFFTTLTAQIRMLPEYDESYTLALVGSYQEPDFYQTRFPFAREMAGLTGFLPDNYSNGRFLEYYIGSSLPMASAEEIQKLAESEAITEMSPYPSYGSIAIIDQYIVVKLS